MDDEKMGVGIAGTIREMTDRANAMAAETRLQFDTLVTMQKDERIEMQKMFQEERAHDRKLFGRIICGLILALVILLSGIIGTAAYVLTNFDIGTTYQETHDSSIIHDGIHIKGDE